MFYSLDYWFDVLAAKQTFYEANIFSDYFILKTETWCHHVTSSHGRNYQLLLTFSFWSLNHEAISDIRYYITGTLLWWLWEELTTKSLLIQITRPDGLTLTFICSFFEKTEN